MPALATTDLIAFALPGTKIINPARPGLPPGESGLRVWRGRAKIDVARRAGFPRGDFADGS
jgi:hypothetical protein